MNDTRSRRRLGAIVMMVGASTWACSAMRAGEVPVGVDQPVPSETAPASPRADPAPAAGGIRLILRDGQIPEGGLGAPVVRLNSPFTNGAGQLAFTGALDRGGGEDAFVWFDGSVLWLNSAHPDDALEGAESTLGVSDDGGFVYGTLAAGVDSIWSHEGRVLSVGMPAPGFPEGSLVEGLARATMTPDGKFYSFGEVRSPLLPGMKRRETLSRVLFGSAGVGEPIAPLIRSGDVVDGAVIAPVDGLGLDYEVSDNSQHVIQIARVIDPEVGPRPVPAVFLDGHLPMRRGDPTSNGAMSDFGRVAVNDGGHFLVSGKTDGDPDGDQFIAYDGVPAVWEAGRLASRSDLLVPPAAVRGLSIDNLGRAVHAWSTAGFGTEYLFFACDAAHLEDSVLLLASRKKLFLDDGGRTEVAVAKFNGGNGPTLSLAENDRVYIEVDLETVRGERLEAILELRLPSCPGAE